MSDGEFVVTYEGIEVRILSWHLLLDDGAVLAEREGRARENTDHNGSRPLITRTPPAPALRSNIRHASPLAGTSQIFMSYRDGLLTRGL